MSDYERIERAIVYLTQNVESQPALAEVAAHVHLSPFHFQRLFSRWAGVTPKRFLQILTVNRAKELLRASLPTLDTSNEVGLSSGSRLHDHFVQVEAVTPGQFKTRGIGLHIQYGVNTTPFGDAFLAKTQRGICQLDFLENREVESHRLTLAESWPEAQLVEDNASVGQSLRSIFSRNVSGPKPLSLHVQGTNFQVNVWKALLNVPMGRVSTYGAIASAIGCPSSARAVGTAVGANPIAFVVPCHRVIRSTGEMGGYRWGLTRKHAIHAWESADES